MNTINIRATSVRAAVLATGVTATLWGALVLGSGIPRGVLPVPSGDLGEVVVVARREAPTLAALPVPSGDLGEVVVVVRREAPTLAALPVPSGDLGEVVVRVPRAITGPEWNEHPTAKIAQR